MRRYKRNGRIGILGGTFDPVHNGHIALAEGALKELKLDRLFFVPAKNAPLKQHSPHSSAHHRLRMLRLALQEATRLRVQFREHSRPLGQNIARCKISTLELRRSGHSYTVETVREFQARFPKDQLFFVMGSDCLGAFKKWKEWREILKICTLAVARRAGLGMRFRSDGEKYRKKIVWLKSEIPEISSTQIRREIRSGTKSLKGLPPVVSGYIRKHHLYAGHY